MDPAIVYAVLFCAGCLALAYAPAIWEFFQDLWNALRDRVDNLRRIQPTVLRQAIEPVGREALPAHNHLTPEDVLWLVRRDWVPPQATVDRLKELAAKTNAALNQAHADREAERKHRQAMDYWKAREAELDVKARLTLSSTRVTVPPFDYNATAEYVRDVVVRNGGRRNVYMQGGHLYYLTDVQANLAQLKADATKIRKELGQERQRMAEAEAKIQRSLGIVRRHPGAFQEVGPDPFHTEHVYTAGQAEPVASYYLG